VTLTEKQRILLETTAARDKAEALLRGLMDAKATSERHLEQIKQPDAMKLVTGKSAMDNAIASTQRMLESLNRALTDLHEGLDEQDLDLLRANGSAGGHADA
jgi:hypothetical protein